MSNATAAPDAAPDVAPDVWAELNYLAPMSARPRTYTYEPPAGTPQTNTVNEPHRVPVHDLRAQAGRFTLDGQGFALLGHQSAVTHFDDDDEIRSVYYPEAERLLREVTGADRVFIFDHTLRRRVPGAKDYRDGPRQPATRVHVDHTAKSGPQRVRDLLPDEAEALLRGRVQVINLWRPIRHPVYDAPLALCDATTVRAEDLVASDLVYPNRVGETYSVRYDAGHRWFYAPQMRPDEALLLKCTDSRTDVAARFTPHSAFLEPDVPADAPLRESIELRTLVFHAA